MTAQIDLAGSFSLPGTSSSLKHLRENLQASTLQIPSEVLINLDSINGHEKEF
jgi:hypothetical protein